MKRVVLLLATVAVLLLWVSGFPFPANAGILVADEQSGFCILDLLPLWDIEAGQTQWKECLRIGEKVALSGSHAMALQYGIERDFVQVRRDSGTEGWVRTDHIVAEATLGVTIADEAILHAHPDSASGTGKTIPKMTILAIHRQSAPGIYLRVSVVDADHILRKQAFLHRKDISTAADDVQRAMQWQMACQSGCCPVPPRRIIPTPLSLPAAAQP